MLKYEIEIKQEELLLHLKPTNLFSFYVQDA